jgi:fucokinase
LDAKKIFLQQSYNDNWDIYVKTLENESYVPRWDLFIVTASNEEQAKAYRLQIEYRLKNGYLPTSTRFMVIADPEGKRVGSGGATINALYKAAKDCGWSCENPFFNKRVLIIHSGGDSKRIPQYSAFGKLFSRVPRELPDGRYSTLFDEFVIALSGVPSRMKDGVLIASGDVLILFNHNAVDFGRQGALGIAIKVPVEMGTRHGVYVNDTKAKVIKFLHKMPIEVLKKENAVNEQDCVNVDTGLVWMDAEICNKLVRLITSDNKLDIHKYNMFVSKKLRLNFYGDFLIPFTEKASLEKYLKEETEGIYCEELVEVRKRIWEAFNSHTLYVQALSPAEFIHFGTTEEFRELMGKIENKYAFISWKKNVLSYDFLKERKANITLINSYINKDAEIGDNVLLEDCRIESGCRIEDGCMLSNVLINKPLLLKRDLVLHQLPVICKDGNKGYVTRFYGVFDNPKDKLDRATFLNEPLKDILSSGILKEEDLWGAESNKTLWEAKLYPICSTVEESLDFAMLLSRIRQASPGELELLKSMPRVSLKSSYEAADQDKILSYQNENEDIIRTKNFIELSIQGYWIRDTYKILGSSSGQIYRRTKIVLDKIPSLENSFYRARLYRMIAEVIRMYPKLEQGTESQMNWRALEDKCYEEINKSIQDSTISPESILKKTDIRVFEEIAAASISALELGKAVCVEAPARVNFGGGWSDTPPYSIEKGGTVLNAAVSLKGKLPIKVKAKLINEPVIRFESMDLNIIKSFDSLEELQSYEDPTDSLALHKAALVVAGIIPVKNEKSSVSLSSILTKIGAGIYLCTEVDIPKGSGLGTSSILAGAVLKAVNGLLGFEYNDQRIFDQVLCLEQILTTGGGWQDQVGGLVPGIKLVTSKPGLPQHIDYTNLNLEDHILKELNERLVLVYTGQRRLAKGILREIMGEYIIQNPEMLECLSHIQKLALLMKYELEKGNIDNFAELLNEHWETSKRLDRGCTNSYIDQIIEISKPYISGVMICGAGGGGFLQMILKHGSQRKPLRKALEDVFQDNNVGIWNCEIIN